MTDDTSAMTLSSLVSYTWLAGAGIRLIELYGSPQFPKLI